MQFFWRKSSISITTCYRALTKKVRVFWSPPSIRAQACKNKAESRSCSGRIWTCEPKSAKTKEKCEWNGYMNMNNHNIHNLFFLLSSVYNSRNLILFKCCCLQNGSLWISVSAESELHMASFPHLWALLCWPTKSIGWLCVTEPERFNLFYVGRSLLMKFAYKDRSRLFPTSKILMPL